MYVCVKERESMKLYISTTKSELAVSAFCDHGRVLIQ